MNNFYDHQARARALTRRLVLLWSCSVIALIAFTTILCVGAARILQANTDPYYRFQLNDLIQMGTTDLDPLYFGAVGGFILLGIGLMSFIKGIQLRTGGAAVAQMLGGRRIDPASTDKYDRRIYNVVHEMALAAGMPTPDVYVIEDTAINAFAAGRTPEDAVIGLTSGAIDVLERQELQGVIAHEFSHIANGDMKLNLRVIIAIAGLTFIYIMGRMLLEISRGSGRKNVAPFLALGLILMTIGLIGTFFGYIIQAAISRQREYLADASAVQYTRNPKGIASALRKISQAGSSLNHPKALECSHMMFSQGFRSKLFATHPPIRKRIERLNGTA